MPKIPLNGTVEVQPEVLITTGWRPVIRCNILIKFETGLEVNGTTFLPSYTDYEEDVLYEKASERLHAKIRDLIVEGLLSNRDWVGYLPDYIRVAERIAKEWRFDLNALLIADYFEEYARKERHESDSMG